MEVKFKLDKWELTSYAERRIYFPGIPDVCVLGGATIVLFYA